MTTWHALIPTANAIIASRRSIERLLASALCERDVMQSTMLGLKMVSDVVQSLSSAPLIDDLVGSWYLGM